MVRAMSDVAGRPTAPASVRNVCIIAHVDHGKSTLADRFLEITGTIESRDMRDQLLDQMDLERERGITIKLQPVRMQYDANGTETTIHLIDTPGHVDFTYEVSRSLAAVEGAILLVDATQGVQAQTISNLYLAREQGLAIIPVVNKIDLPNADVEGVVRSLATLIGVPPEDVLRVSAKTGEGVDRVLAAVVDRVPVPAMRADLPGRALIFDSAYDDYQGVIAYVRVVDGTFRKGQHVRFLGTSAEGPITTIGTFHPERTELTTLPVGSIGFIGIGRKDAVSCQVGDTIAPADATVEQLPGYRQLQPMVFAGLYPVEGDDAMKLREALEKVHLSDAALQYEPERSQALGPGFRCGFLGMLHLEVTQQRLEREHNLPLVVTVPSVAYRVTRTDGTADVARSPIELGDPGTIREVQEPIMRVQIVTPTEWLGSVMKLVQQRRGQYRTTEYIDDRRARLFYDIPLAALITDFYDTLKSVSSGYASLSYDVHGYAPADVIRLDILVAGTIEEPLSSIVYRDESYRVGRAILAKLKDVLPRQLFEVRLQAAIGGTIIAAERIPALRKDVTAKLYGGDVTRKRKLLEKQKRGKKRMRAHGRVQLPPAAYTAVLRKGSR